MSKKSSTADAAPDTKKGDDVRPEDGEPAMIACSCGNMVAVGEPFCNICGTILEATTGEESGPPPTPPGAMPPHSQTDAPHGGHEPMAADPHPQGIPAMYPPQSPPPNAMYTPPGAGAYAAQTVYPQSYGAQMPASPAPNTQLYPGGPCTCGVMLAPGQSYCSSCGQTVPPGGHRAPYGQPYGSAAVDASGRTATRRERILLIDHQTDATAYTQRILSLEQYDALTAADGHDGLILAITAQPDLILLDLDLPGLDGFALCRVLRANAPTRQTPIIVVTGRATVDDEIHALKSGADDFLVKPVDSNRLLARVEAHLRRQRSRR